MPTPPDPRTLELEYRLMRSIEAWLTTPISPDPTTLLEPARQLLVTAIPRRRDEAGPITPQDDATKAPRLILKLTDHGRTKPYAPIRSLRLELELRANSKMTSGQEDAWVALVGALELLLDSTNLQAALTSSTWAVAVMLAVRSGGSSHRVEGDVRKKTVTVELRAVGLEHTA